MLQSLELECFKGFNNRVRVDLAPITLIYGANSSGKSSFLQSLLLLRQSLEQAAQPDSALTFRSDEFVDLGNFENVVFAHNTKRLLTIGVGIGDFTTRARVPRPTLRKAGQLPQQISDARLAFSFGTDKQSQVFVDAVNLFFDSEEAPTFTLSTESQVAKKSSTNESVIGQRKPLRLTHVNIESSYVRAAFKTFLDVTRPRWLAELEQYQQYFKRSTGERTPRRRGAGNDKSTNDDLERRIQRLRAYSIDDFKMDIDSITKRSLFTLANFLPGRIISTGQANEEPMPSRTLGFLDAFSEDVMDVFGPILAATESLRGQLNSLGYIGPLRQYPERNYIFSGTSSNSVGTRGENLPHILFSENVHHASLNELASALGLGYDVKVTHSRSRDLSNVFAVRLVDKQSKINVGLNDVGFGISQVLPILLQSSLDGVKTVLIEQPEIHLHPKLQAAVSEVFARAVSTSEDRQFIIETHSEHMLLRLQRLIRLQELDARKVRLLFVSRDKGGSHVQELRLDENGDLLDRFPGGFFDDVYNEQFGI